MARSQEAPNFAEAPNRKLESLFLERNFIPFSEYELYTFAETYFHAMQQKLDGGDGMGLAMIDSRVAKVDYDKLGHNKKALVIVVGGTNLRWAIVSSESGKNPRIFRDPDTQTAFYGQVNVGQKVVESSEEFYKSIASQVGKFIQGFELPIDAVGIIYSFNGSVQHMGNNLDLVPSEAMGKGFKVPGISDRPFGQQLLGTLELAKYKELPYVVINDMTGVCIGADADIGVINATGVNLAMLVNDTYHITECGHFSQVIQSDYDIWQDKQSNNPGQALAEKQLSGRYLGEKLGIVVKDMIKQGIISVDLPGSGQFISEDVSHFMGNPRGYNEEVAAAFKYASTMVAVRSAQLLGTFIGSSVAFMDVHHPIHIPVEGALLWSIPHYKDITQYYAQKIAQVPIEFSHIEHPDVVGAGVLAISRST